MNLKQSEKTYLTKLNQVKKILRRNVIMQRYRTLKSRYQSWKLYNFKGSNRAVPFLFNLVTSVLIGSSFMEAGPPPILTFAISSLIVFLVLMLVRKVILWLVKPLFKNNSQTIFVIIQFLLTCIVIWTVSAGSSSKNVWLPLIFIGLFLTWIELMFVRSLYNIFIKRIHSITLGITLLITIIINTAAGIFFFSEGFTDTYRQEFLRLNATSSNKTSFLKADKLELKKGPYQITSVEYGMEGEELVSDTINLSSFISYDGFTKLLRDFYWGYSINKVPLKGKVWYPSTGGNYPVLFIIHGNHILTTDSYLGYTYLSEYLASYGYVVVSVDENFCNGYINEGLSHENDGRAVLLLENMKLFNTYNQNPNHPLYEKMDFEKITLAGHSRGGEAAATAVLFNQLNYFPDNGNVRFSYDFNIKSVIAIAPVSDQYRPSGKDVELTDINYLLLHGSNDQDVSCMMGEKQYNNISFTGMEECFKAYLYIAGANHGQFNTQWGRKDLPEPVNLLLNTKNLIKENEQKNILLIAVKAFLDATIKKDGDALNFFKNYTTSNIFLPETVYLEGYGDSTMNTLCDYEEDADLSTGAPGVSIAAYGASSWYENQTYYELSSKDRDNHALSFYWTNRKTAFYQLELKTPYQGENKYLQFDLMDLREEPKIKEDFELLNFTIMLTDKEGEEARVSLEDYYTIYPSLPVKINKIQFITDTPVYKHYFQTVRIPVEAFDKENNAFDSNSIVKVSFLFDKQEMGRIRVDRIGVSN